MKEKKFYRKAIASTQEAPELDLSKLTKRKQFPGHSNPPPPPNNPMDKQIGGNHYKEMNIQPVEFIVANNIPFREGSAIKYICRHAVKNGKQDLEKAIHFLQMIIDTYS